MAPSAKAHGSAQGEQQYGLARLIRGHGEDDDEDPKLTEASAGAEEERSGRVGGMAMTVAPGREIGGGKES